MSISINRRRGWRILAGAAAVVAALAALPGAAAAEDSKPVEGGELIFSDVNLIQVWRRQGGTTFNIGTVLSQITDRLLYQEEGSGRIVPWLAESFEINDDATVFTFRIRDGVTFSDDTKLDAQVVKANLDQYGFGDQAKGIPPSFHFIGYDRTEIVDDHTVKVYLKEPNRYFLVALTSPNSGIAAQSTLDKNWQEQAAPANLIGTGPFVFDHEIPKKEVVLVRREDYAWAPDGLPNRGKAYLQRIVIREIVEEGLRTGALQSGQVDLAKGIQPSDEQTLIDEGFKIYPQKPILNVTDQISLRVQNPLLSDRNVRYALSIGIDRKELVDTVLSPSYLPTTGLLIAGSVGHVKFDDELAYDPQKANRILDDAGWVRNAQGIREKDGKELRLTVAASTQSSALKPALEFIGQQWRQLGVVLINRAGDDPFMTQALHDVNVPLRAFRPGLTAGLVGVFGFAKGLNSNNGTSLHGEPDIEALFAEDLRTNDPEKQQSLLAEIQKKLIVDYVQTIPLYEAAQIFGGSDRVHIRFNSNTLPIFQQTWIDPKN